MRTLEASSAARQISIVLAAASLAIAAGACTSSASPRPGGSPSLATSSPEPAPTGGLSGSPSPSAGLPLEAVCDISDAHSFDVVTTVAGTERSLLVHRSTSARPAPLVIALHGLGGFARELELTTGLSETADAHGFTVVYPEGTGYPHEWGVLASQSQRDRDVALLDTIVDTLASGGCADPSKVVVTGFSMGGIFAHVLACVDADRFHAIVAVSARDLGDPCAPAREVAFVAYNGLLDRVLPYAGGSVEGFDVESVEAWLAAWARRDGCAADPTVAAAGKHVDRLAWQGCRAPVVLYRVRDGGHTWPGSDLKGGTAVDTEVAPNDSIVRLLQGEAP